jgi:hypothetical protein
LLLTSCFIPDSPPDLARSLLTAAPLLPGRAHKLEPARSKLATPPGVGGGERDRTDDLLLAKQALSQLSYTPVIGGSGWVRTIDPRLIKTVL